MNNIGNYCIEDFNFDNNFINISTNYIKLLTSLIFDIIIDNNDDFEILKIIVYQQDTLLCVINDFVVNKINDCHYLFFVNFIKYFKTFNQYNLSGIPILNSHINIECIFNNNINFKKSKYYCQGYLLYDNIINIYHTQKLFYNIGSTICNNCLITKDNNNFSISLNHDILNYIEIFFIDTNDICSIGIYIDDNLYFKIPIYLLVHNNKFMYDFNDFYVKKFKNLNIVFDIKDNFVSTNIFFKIILYNTFDISHNIFSRLK